MYHSQVLTSGGADRLCANRVESSSASDESTLVGCIGHEWLRDVFNQKRVSIINPERNQIRQLI